MLLGACSFSTILCFKLSIRDLQPHVPHCGTIRDFKLRWSQAELIIIPVKQVLSPIFLILSLIPPASETPTMKSLHHDRLLLGLLSTSNQLQLPIASTSATYLKLDPSSTDFQWKLWGEYKYYGVVIEIYKMNECFLCASISVTRDRYNHTKV